MYIDIVVFAYIYVYIYIYIYTSVLLCIYMHRRSGSTCDVDAIVTLTWSKVWITKAITISITKAIANVNRTIGDLQQAWAIEGWSYRGVEKVRQVAQVETRLGTNLVEQLVWSWSLVHLVDTGEDMVTLAWGGPAHWGWRSSVIFFGDTIKFDPQLKNKILLPCGKTQPRNFGVCLSPSSWQFKIQPAVFWAK